MLFSLFFLCLKSFSLFSFSPSLFSFPLLKLWGGHVPPFPPPPWISPFAYVNKKEILHVEIINDYFYFIIMQRWKSRIFLYHTQHFATYQSKIKVTHYIRVNLNIKIFVLLKNGMFSRSYVLHHSDIAYSKVLKKINCNFFF